MGSDGLSSWGASLHSLKVWGKRIGRHGAPVLLSTLKSRVMGDGHAQRVLELLRAMGSRPLKAPPPESNPLRHDLPPGGGYRLFAWQLSYFSGKVRGYLRYKARLSGLSFQEVLATPEIIAKVLVPATASNTVPQLQLPTGEILHDSSEIIEAVEREHPEPGVVPPAASRPRQHLTCMLLEMLGDEWMLVAAYHWRWAYSTDGSAGQRMPCTPGKGNHRGFNELQWGDFLHPTGTPAERRATAAWLFDNVFYRIGPSVGCAALGVTESTVHAWEASMHRILALLEAHLGAHDFLLGGRPSLADFGLLGPLHAHMHRDPVPGFAVRSRYPLVAAWCERLHDRGGAPPDAEHCELVGGRLVRRELASDGAEWLPEDAIPARRQRGMHARCSTFRL